MTLLRSKCLECLLKNHLSKDVSEVPEVPEVPEIPDGVREASRWFHVVTLAMWNPEHVKSP